MRKSVVTTIVTAMFVVYSFYQRTVGVQANADTIPSPTVPSIASGSSQSPGSNAAPAPTSPSPPVQTRSDPSQAAAGSAPTSTPQASPTPAQASGSPYKNGTYTGAAADAFYGNVQVQATIANGKLTNVKFLQWPNDRFRSVRINQQALPWLVQEAIQAQSANVDMISGATDSSEAFTESLQSALSEAKS